MSAPTVTSPAEEPRDPRGHRRYVPGKGTRRPVNGRLLPPTDYVPARLITRLLPRQVRRWVA
jgi:hypothetical protein